MRIPRLRRTRHEAKRGQALVEFALVLLPLMLIVVGIAQFGLLLSANVTLTNAAREGARAAMTYEYDVMQGRDTNDQRRCTAVVQAVSQSLGVLPVAPANFTVTNPCAASSGNTWTSGDVVIEYAQPTGVLTNDARNRYNVTVRVTYRQDIIVPLIGPLLSRDASGRFVQQSRVTMVIA